jgi:tRNA-specific 2-thiouridylase
VAEYAAGRTPNPCLRCNEKIKFSAVLDRGVALGFDAVCTGHYASLVRTDEGVELHRAVDADKDQSYVLGVLDEGQLARSYFPLGGSLKSEVRAEADRRGLAVADKPDSHDICFIPDGDTAGFLDRQLGQRPGVVVDQAGQQVGRHEGSHHFTIGQRRGLRLGVPTDDGRPRYVLDISPVSNTVTVGPHDALAVRRIEGLKPRWAGPVSPGAWRGSVQVRAHGAALPASALIETDRVELVLDESAMGVAPGQAAVLYDGTRVVGSATIAGTQP